MRFQGCIPIYRNSLKRTRLALDYALDSLRWSPAGIAVFPEGTRSPHGNLLPYHRGTFNLASRAGVPLVPFALDGTGALMPRGAWAPRPGVIRLVFGEPISVEEIARLTLDELMQRARACTETALATLRSRPAR